MGEAGMRARLSSSGVSGELHAGRLYQVRSGAGYPAATSRVGILACFPVEFVEPQGVMDEESIFSAK